MMMTKKNRDKKPWKIENERKKEKVSLLFLVRSGIDDENVKNKKPTKKTRQSHLPTTLSWMNRLIFGIVEICIMIKNRKEKQKKIRTEMGLLICTQTPTPTRTPTHQHTHTSSSSSLFNQRIPDKVVIHYSVYIYNVNNQNFLYI